MTGGTGANCGGWRVWAADAKRSGRAPQRAVPTVGWDEWEVFPKRRSSRQTRARFVRLTLSCIPERALNILQHALNIPPTSALRAGLTGTSRALFQVAEVVMRAFIQCAVVATPPKL